MNISHIRSLFGGGGIPYIPCPPRCPPPPAGAAQGRPLQPFLAQPLRCHPPAQRAPGPSGGYFSFAIESVGVSSTVSIIVVVA